MSGGQYQLLNVWACLGCGADLVLLDEPTNNMDPRPPPLSRRSSSPRASGPRHADREPRARLPGAGLARASWRLGR